MSIVKMFQLRRPRGDGGVALLLVVACMLIGTMFAFAGLSYALSTQKFSKKNQDWNAALAAAQAGVDDYISMLNKNDNYARTPLDCTNEALQGPTTATNACGWTASTPVSWKQINPTDPSQGSFHYDIDVTKLDSVGNVLVTSTGKAGTRTRTLQVGVGKADSTHFLYYTDHEDADPDNDQAYSGTMDPRCAQYWWAGRKAISSSAGCQEITFIGGDELDGLAHTNDTPLFSNSGSTKPKFSAGFETSDPKCHLTTDDVPGPVNPTVPSTFVNCDRTGNSADYAGSYPRWAKELVLPDNSDAFKTFPGCQYQGATRIKFLSSGQMKVWSAESTSPTTSAACGGSTAALTNGAGATVNVPTDQIVYVGGGTSGPHQCKSGEIGDGLPLGTFDGNSLRNFSYDLNMLVTDQACGKGNAYVEGTLKGRVTVATENSLVVTGDVVYANGLAGSDMLGLVAGNSVEVFHPWIDTWSCKNWNSSHTACRSGIANWGYDNSPNEDSSWPHRYNDADALPSPAPNPSAGVQIAGSIQTLQHSFFVQSYDKGSYQGKLYVRGSIAQRWRGIVGRGSPPSTGYLKNYKYDKRLKYSSPPYFPDWTNSEWAGNYTGEIAPKYK
jgi:Tfp pilus assembly protein PilX